MNIRYQSEGSSHSSTLWLGEAMNSNTKHSTAGVGISNGPLAGLYHIPNTSFKAVSLLN